MSSKGISMDRFGVWLQFDNGDDSLEEDFYWNTRISELRQTTMSDATEILNKHDHKFACTLLPDKRAANIEEREKSFAATAVMVGDNVGTLKQLYKKMTDTKQITEDSVNTVLCPSRRIVKPPEKMLISESTEVEDNQKLLAAKRKKNDLNLQKRKIVQEKTETATLKQDDLRKKFKVVEVIEGADGVERKVTKNEDTTLLLGTNDSSGFKTPDQSPVETVRVLQLEKDASDFLIERDVARQERDQLQQQVCDLQMSINQNKDHDFNFKLKKLQDTTQDIERKLDLVNDTLSFLKTHIISQQCENLVKNVETHHASSSSYSALDNSVSDFGDPPVEDDHSTQTQDSHLSDGDETTKSGTKASKQLVSSYDESEDAGNVTMDSEAETQPQNSMPEELRPNKPINDSGKQSHRKIQSPSAANTQNAGDTRLEKQRLYRETDDIFRDGKETPVALSNKVCVPKSVLDNLVRHSTKSQGCFGLNLIRGLVKPEYLINNTLYGSMRGRKGGIAAPGIAPEIIDAVFKYIPIARNRILKTHSVQQTRAKRPGEKIITAGMAAQWNVLDEGKVKSAINKGLGKCVTDTTTRGNDEVPDDEDDLFLS